jgi:tetratricopeptide (TPR) repeat protein
MPAEPDPGKISTVADFGRALTIARERAGLTVRDIADAAGIPSSTLGGYFGGTHLPGLKPPNLLHDILRICRVVDPSEVEQWVDAWRRVRHSRKTSRVGTGAAAPLQAPLHWTVTIKPPVGRLTHGPSVRGRTKLLRLLTEGIDRQFTSGDAEPSLYADHPRVHVVHGLGGSGKSTVALVLAHMAMDRGVATWWITVEGPASIQAGMAALAVELGVTDNQLRMGSLPDLVWRRLERHRQPWLLVIDNADDPETDLVTSTGSVLDGTGWVRPVPGPFGMVVVTTRNGSARSWGVPSTRDSTGLADFPATRAVPGLAAPSRNGFAGPPRPWLRLDRVAVLSAEDTGLVLHELAGDAAGPPDAAVALGKRLGGLPLAAAHAGRYLAEARRLPPALAGSEIVRTYEQYGRALDQGRHRTLFDGFGQPSRPGRRGERELLGQTWELSLDLLDARGARGPRHARALLQLISCLGLAPVPYGLILRADVVTRSPLFPGMTTASLWGLVRALADVGLVDIERGGTAEPAVADLLHVHPLVRETFRDSADVRDHIGLYLDLLTRLLARAAGDLDPSNPSSWPSWRMLAVHCASPMDLLRRHGPGEGDAHEPGGAPPAAPPPPSGLLEPTLNAGRYLRAVGRLAEAEAGYAIALEHGRPRLGNDHPDVLAVRHDLGRVLLGLGRLDDAERGLRAVLDARLRVLGPEHPDTLTTQHYLGRVVRDRGRSDEAEEWFARTLAARRCVLGDRHRDTLTSRNNLGDLLRERRVFDQAELMLRSVRSERGELLGEDHPATLVTRSYLVRLWMDCSRWAEAEAEAEALAETCRVVLGDDHARTFAARLLRGEIHLGLGQVEQAVRIFRAVLENSRRVLGPDHPMTLRAENLLDGQRHDTDTGHSRTRTSELVAGKRASPTW